jgi:subtilisin family serine protease
MCRRTGEIVKRHIAFGRSVRVLLAISLVMMLLPGVALGESVRGSTTPDGPTRDTPKAAPAPSHYRGWSAADNGKGYVEGELLVRFKSGILGTAAATTAHSAVGASVSRNLDAVDGLQLVKLKAGMSVEDAVAAYAAMPSVLSVQPNFTTKELASLPDDPMFELLWGLHNTGQTILTPGGNVAGTADADMDLPEAWAATTGSDAVVVAVIDTGVDYKHPDLVDNMWVNPGEVPDNHVDDDGNGYVDDVYGIDSINLDSDPMDDHGHGTHCAGTIGGTGNDGAGIVGVNWDVSIMALKIFDADGSTNTAAIIQAFAYADEMGADVLSCSWGGLGPSAYDALEEAAIGACTDALIVCAAGNENTNIDVTPYYPACYDFDNIIAVGASNGNDAMALGDGGAPFSDYGATNVDVFAPGQDIWSAGLPDYSIDVACDYTVLFEDQFGDMSNWSTTYATDPWALYGGYALTPPYSCGLVPYGNNESSWIDCTVPLDLTTATNPHMYWRMGCDIEEGWDVVYWGVYDASDDAYYDLGQFTGVTDTPFDYFEADLSAFIGEDDIYLYFGLESDPIISAKDSSAYLGVFIDDLQVWDLDYVESTLLDDGFDAGGDGWANSYVDYTPWTWDGTAGHDAAGSWKLAPYVDNESSWLQSPSFDLTWGGTLGFWYNIGLETNWDYLRVYVESDQGSQLLQQYTGNSGGWRYAEFELFEFFGDDNVRIYFVLYSDFMIDSAFGYAGAWIDDVTVQTSPLGLVGDYTEAYECWDGTSMATPHVAGLAALLLAKNPDLTPAELRAAIEGTVDEKPAFTGKCTTGGRVNADAALDSVDETPPATSVSVDRAVPNGAAGWYLFGTSGPGSAPQITLTADEPATTYYFWDSDAPTEYTGAFSMELGEHVLTYWSVDVASNEETPRNTVTYKYDNGGPPAPPDLLAEALSATSVRLTWGEAVDNYSGTAFYHIDRAAPLPHAALGTTPDEATRTFDVTGLVPGTEYTFWVWGQDYANWGGNYSEVTITTPSAGGTATIEEDAKGVYFGRLIRGVGAAYSGGSYVYGYSKAPYTGTRFETSFTGSKVRWIGPKQPNYGQAKVYVDGAYVTTVDCYAAPGDAAISATLWQSAALTDGPHTLAIEMGSAKNAASSNYIVVIDKIEVEGATPAGPAGDRTNETTGTFIGGWMKNLTNTTYTYGTYAYSYWAGARFVKSFYGTRVAWVGPKVYNYGRAAVYIDGVYKGTVSQYAPGASIGFRQKVWESAVLPEGNHTLEIRVLGTKDAASTGTFIVVDSIDVTSPSTD